MSFGTRTSDPLRNVLDPSFYPINIRRLYLHQLQFQFLVVHNGFVYRWLVILARIVLDLWIDPGEHPHLLNLDAALVCWEFLAWLVCRLLFRHPEHFLWFRRPSRNYLRAVFVAISVIIVPNIAIQVTIICLSTKIEIELSRSWTVAIAVIGLLLTIPFFTLIFKMAQKYLLVDQDDQYEPTIARENMANSERYTDQETSTSSSSSPLLPGILSAAYMNQTFSSTCTTSYQHPSTSSQILQAPESLAEETVTIVDEQDNSITIAPVDNAIMTNPTYSTPGCHSLAYFEFMPQSRKGAGAWISFPIIPAFFGLYSTITLGLMISLLHEDNKYPSIKSPDTVYAFFMVSSGYALCFFTAKFRLRTTLFIKRSTSLPGGWTEVSHWILGTTYIHTETNTTTDDDPRYRTHDYSQTLEEREYHSNSGTQQRGCNEFWGHNGRGVTIKRRFWSMIVRLSILIIIVKYFFKGATTIAFGMVNGRLASTPEEVDHHLHMIYLTSRYTMWLFPLYLGVSSYTVQFFPPVLSFWLSALKDGKVPDTGSVKWIY